MPQSRPPLTAAIEIHRGLRVLCLCRSRVASSLEKKLNGYLTDARIVGAGHKSEIGIEEVPLRFPELSMIEDIEKLGAELQALGFRQTQVFQQREIPVVEARSVKEAPAGIPKLSLRLSAEK